MINRGIRGGLLLGLLLISVGLTACGHEEKRQIYGEELVKNSFLCTEEDMLACELPLITDKPIREGVELGEVSVTGDGSYLLDYQSLTGGRSYQGWYTYFVNLMISVAPDQAADFDIDSVTLMIDGEPYLYRPGCLHFENALARFGDEVGTDGSAMAYGSGKTMIFQQIPDSLAQKQEIEIREDCLIKDLVFLDFVDLISLKTCLNDQAVDLDQGIEAKPGDTLTIEYQLAYREGCRDMDLLKTSQYLYYINSQGEGEVFNDPQGLIIVHYEDDNFIRERIDEIIASAEKGGLNK